MIQASLPYKVSGLGAGGQAGFFQPNSDLAESRFVGGIRRVVSNLVRRSEFFANLVKEIAEIALGRVERPCTGFQRQPVHHPDSVLIPSRQLSLFSLGVAHAI